VTKTFMSVYDVTKWPKRLRQSMMLQSDQNVYVSLWCYKVTKIFMSVYDVTKWPKRLCQSIMLQSDQNQETVTWRIPNLETWKIFQRKHLWNVYTLPPFRHLISAYLLLLKHNFLNNFKINLWFTIILNITEHLKRIAYFICH
jgi:hypothetical protein